MGSSGSWSSAPLVLMLGCSTVYVPPVYTDRNDETGPAIGEEPPIGPNDTVFSKIEYDENYSRIAVGNVARTVEDPGCCLDYVLAGPGADDVRVVFGGGKDTGLTFLDDRPDEVLELGPSDDVALVDLNEDGRNDLIALGEDHQLDVRLGVANPGPDGPFLAQNGVSSPTAAALAPYPTQGEGAGDLATGDVDADGHIDVVVADGSFTVLLDAQNDRTFDVKQRHVLRPVADDPCPPNQTACRNETATAVIAAGPFCVSTPGADLAYAYEDKVWIICGNAGNFAEVGEEPHGSGVGPGSPVADYRFDLNGPSTRYDGVIDDIFVVDDDIYVLRQPTVLGGPPTFIIAHAHRVIHLAIDHDTLDQGKGEPVLELYASTARVVLHPASLDSSAMRLAWPALGLARWRSP